MPRDVPRWTSSQIQVLFEEVQGIQFYRRKISDSGNNVLVLEVGSSEEIQRLVNGTKGRTFHVYISDVRLREEFRVHLSQHLSHQHRSENIINVLDVNVLEDWSPEQPMDLIIAPRGLKGINTYQKMETLLEWMRQALSPGGTAVFDQWMPIDAHFSRLSVHFKSIKTIDDNHFVVMLQSSHVEENANDVPTITLKEAKKPRTMVKSLWFEVYDKDTATLVQKFFMQEKHAIFSLDEIMELASTKFKQVLFLGNHETEELYRDGDPVMITVLSKPIK